MKCDLHVHLVQSGTLPVTIPRYFVPESYSRPHRACATLRKRGMDLVTLTDHMKREDRWTIMVTPLLVLVPAGAAINFLHDLGFARRWSGRIGLVPSGLRMTLPVDQKQPA
jgi:hypothetical protein